MARSATVFLFFLALAVILTAPVSLQPHRLAMDDGDPLIGSWILAWNAHQIVRAPWSLFDSNTFFPYEDSLAFSEHLFVPGMLSAPFYYLSGSALLAHNLTVLLTFALSAWAMWLLVKEIFGRADVAILAGVIYIFQTYAFHEAARVQIVSLQWWPIALLFLHRTFRGERTRRNAALFVFFFLLQALSCTYYLFYFALVLAFWLPAYAWTSEEPWRRMRELVLPGALAVSVLLLFFLPYQRVLERFEPHRELGGGLAASDYVRPFEGSLMANALSPRVAPSTVPHFLGYLPLVLAAFGLLWAPRRGEPGRLFFVLAIAAALVGFALSLTRGPYPVLYEHVPGFQYLRGPDRMSVLVQFGLAVAAAWGAGQILNRLPARAASVACVALLVLLPFEHVGLRRSTEIPTGDATPEVYRWLESLDDDGAVVELPLFPREQLRLHALYMFYSTYHWKPIVFGKTSFYPPLVGYLGWELRDFPSPETLALLRRSGVARVIVRPELWPPKERAANLAKLDGLQPELVPEGRFPPLTLPSQTRYGFGSERVYKLEEKKAPDVPLCVPQDAIDPGRWKIHGNGQNDPSLAIDGERSTAWRSEGQLPGIALELDLGREETVAAVEIAIAYPYDGFPRDLTLKMRSPETARYERVFFRDDVATKLEVVDALIDRPEDAAMVLRFEPVRTRRIRFWIREGKEFDYALPDWSLPELTLYRACTGER